MKLDLTKVPLNEYGHVQTKEGKPARIICRDMKRLQGAFDNHKFLGLVNHESHEASFCWTDNGKSNGEREHDLILVTKKHTVWMNMHRTNFGGIMGYGYSSKDMASGISKEIIACVRVEFEEGEGL